MNENVVEPFNQDVAALGAYVYTDSNRFSSWCANKRQTCETIAAVPMAGKRVVDVGCGDGTYTAVLRKATNAKHILGIDPAGKAIERAREHYSSNCDDLAFKCCFSKELVAAGEHFDIAVYRGVIHHVSDPGAEIASALQLADIVFFDEPNGCNPILKIIERVSSYHRAHGEQSYRFGQLRRWIHDGGGKVVRAKYFNLVPYFSPDWIAKLCSSLEPVVERIPLMRMVCCGHIGIVASARDKSPHASR